MKQGIRVFALSTLLAATPLQAAEVRSIVKAIDPKASASTTITIFTSATRVVPDEPPFTTIIAALCKNKKVLIGVDKVEVFSKHAFNRVDFQQIDFLEDLIDACDDIAAGRPLAAYAVMK